MTYSDSEGESYNWTGGWRLKKKQLEEDIARKNEQLNQLMNDIQKLEEQAQLQQVNENALRTRLQDTTEEIEGLILDYSAVQETNKHMQERLLEAQEQEASLKARLEEALQQKQQQQKHQAELNTAVEERLDKLQQLLAQREKQLQQVQEERLLDREQLQQTRNKFTATRPSCTETVIARLRSELETKEQQVLQLSNKLEEATQQIDESAVLIEKIRSKTQNSSADEAQQRVQQLSKQLQQEKQLVSRLKLQLVSAEEDAQIHARDLAAVTESLNAYMSGELSLADAVKELKAARRQLARREEQVSQLTADNNTLHLNLHDIMEENTQLRAQLKLEPRQSLPGPKSSTITWENSKQIISKLNKKIQKLEDEKTNLRTEVFALMRKVSNQRAQIKITALELPIKEALASLAAEGMNAETKMQLQQLREAVGNLGTELHHLTVGGARQTAKRHDADDEDMWSVNENRELARNIVAELRKEIDSVTQRAEQYREQAMAQKVLLASYRRQLNAIQTSETEHFEKEPNQVIEDCSVESGQLDFIETANHDRSDGVSLESSNKNTTLPEDADERAKNSFINVTFDKDQRWTNILQENHETILILNQNLSAILSTIRSAADKTHNNSLRVFGACLNQLAQEIIRERQHAVYVLNQSKDKDFESSVTLRQLQLSIEHLNTMQEISRNEQTEQNVAKWCQNFHKQRQANVDLEERLKRLNDDHVKLCAVLELKESQLLKALEAIAANISSAENLDCDHDLVSIAIQTDETLNRSPLFPYGSDVLDQAIIELEKERALNASLQESLMQKELNIISKEQHINKLKNDLVVSKKLHKSVDFASTSEVAHAVSCGEDREDTALLIEQLKSSAEENKKTILRYQLLLEKTHSEFQSETNRLKEEITVAVKERDEALKKVSELQLSLDSIPCRDTDLGHAQRTVIVQQVQALHETNRLLEKQLSECRKEKLMLEGNERHLERLLREEQEARQKETQRQQIACNYKTKSMEEEIKRLLAQIKTMDDKLEKTSSELSALRRKSAENPSIVLTALIQKLRDKLIEKEKYIALIESKSTKN